MSRNIALTTGKTTNELSDKELMVEVLAELIEINQHLALIRQGMADLATICSDGFAM